MPPTLNEIRKKLAKVIEDGTDATVYAYPRITNKGELPAVMIEPVVADFMETMNRGSDEWFFTVYVLVKMSGDEDAAQDELDEFVTGVGPNSIRQIVWDNRELFKGVTAFVYGMTDYGGSFKWGEAQHIGAKLKARVVVDNS